MSRVPDFFTPATSYADRAATIVENRIQTAQTNATQLTSSANNALAALANATFQITEPPPTPPTIGDLQTSLSAPTAPYQRSFGSINSPGTMAPPTVEDYTMPTVNFDDFTPSITGLIIPEAPVPGSFIVPTKPTYASPTLPGDPSVVIPGMDPLLSLSIPDFVFPTLPTFDGTEPVFDEVKPSNSFSWSDPAYATEVLDDVVSKIKDVFSGSTGLPPAVEQALFERMNDREDNLVAKAVSEASDEFSARGFQNPPGAMASRIDMIRQEAMLKKQGAHRDLTIKFAEWEIENFRVALQQGVAAEQVYSNIWNNVVQRMFEAAKYQVEASIQIYNALVNAFNAKMLGYQTAASVYKTRLEGALAEVDVYKARIEAEKAKATINQVIVQAYEARIRAALGQVEIYKAQMEGAKIQADIARIAIEAYKTDVEAYATQVNADKNRFDAYKSRIDGEKAKADILDAEARAFAAKVQGQASQVQAYKAQAEVVAEKNRTNLLAFTSTVERDKARMQYELANIQANVQGFVADVQRFSAEMAGNAEIAKVDIAAFTAESQVNVAFYQAQVAAYTQRVEQMLREAALTIESMKTVASVAATLAAGAMAGISAQAQISGAGTVDARGSVSASDQFSIQYNVSSEGAPPSIVP